MLVTTPVAVQSRCYRLASVVSYATKATLRMSVQQQFGDTRMPGMAQYVAAVNRIAGVVFCEWYAHWQEYGQHCATGEH